MASREELEAMGITSNNSEKKVNKKNNTVANIIKIIANGKKRKQKKWSGGTRSP